MTVDVVCVGAHPDDVGIGMGGTVAAMDRDAAHWGGLIGAPWGESFFSAEEIGVADIRHLL